MVVGRTVVALAEALNVEEFEAKPPLALGPAAPPRGRICRRSYDPAGAWTVKEPSLQICRAAPHTLVLASHARAVAAVMVGTRTTASVTGSTIEMLPNGRIAARPVTQGRGTSSITPR